MFGPSPAGSFDPNGAVNASDQHGFLRAGRRYRVKREFADYSRSIHPVGETWTFVGSSFVPYDDGLTLYVAIEGQEWSFPMQWRDDQQAPILDALAEYIEEV